MSLFVTEHVQTIVENRWSELRYIPFQVSISIFKMMHLILHSVKL